MDFKKYKAILSLALPVVLSQGLQTILVLMDRYILSFKDPLLTAVVTTSWFTALSLTSFFIAFIAFSTAFIGKSFGQQDEDSCHRILTQSFMFSIIFSPIILMLALWGCWYFKLLQHPAYYYNMEKDYFQIIMIGYIPILFKTSIESYLIGTNKSQVIFTASLLSFLLNMALCYCFVLGPLSHIFKGATGAAIATVLSNCFCLGFLLARASWKIQLHSFFTGLKNLANQALFAGLEKFSTSFFFVLFVNMFVVYGPEVSTSVSLIFTWDQIAFLPLIAIHRSLLSLYSNYLGKKQILSADQILHSTLQLTLILMGAFAVLFLCFSPHLIDLFLEGRNSILNRLDIQNMAQNLFKTAACYIFVVSCIFIYKASLRSLGFSYWCFKYSLLIHVVFVIACYISIYNFHVSPYQIWTYFTAMLCLQALTFILKFYFDPSLRKMRTAQQDV